MSSPLIRGTIDADGIVSRLREIEETRSSGILRFVGEGDSSAIEGEVSLVLGQIANDQAEREDGEDPIELLLELRDGSFEVFQQLPSLPVSRGDRTSREGSLEVHVPADLMNYCERAGLTGSLSLSSGDSHAHIVYDRGELTGIRLEGPKDLHQVFAWEEGSFRVQATASAPVLDVADEDEGEREPTIRIERARKDDTGLQFLEVVEVALTDILREREERRPATRTSPPLPPAPEPKKHATLPPPRKKRAPREDQTVRVIYLRAENDDVHERKTAPDPSKTAPEAPSMTTTTPKTAPESSTPATIGWVLVVFALIMVALVVLSMLPPLD